MGEVAETESSAQPAEKNPAEEAQKVIVQIKNRAEQYAKKKEKNNEMLELLSFIEIEHECLEKDRRRIVQEIAGDPAMISLFEQLKLADVSITLAVDSSNSRDCFFTYGNDGRERGPCSFGSSICEINGKVYIEADDVDARDILDYFMPNQGGRK